LCCTHWPVDVVSAVPLHASRLRERGYNQAVLLAQVVARTRSWVFAPDALRRVRETASQVNLNAQERRANVEAAFFAEPAVFCGRQVLVIDDVLTTGATLSACADALRAAGATHVYGATLAGAVGFRDQ
jgi:ComF family protein